MRSEHLSDAWLNDYAEDLLPPEAREAAAVHLAACAACTAEVEAIRALRAELAGLPDRMDPGVDLRPGIRSRIGGRAPARTGLRAVRPRALVAAAAAVVVAAAAFAAVLVGRGDSGATAAAEAEADDAARTFVALDREYARAATELRTVLDSDRGGLDPETAELVRESLTVVDRALAESRAALAEDPSSPVVRELVLAVHRQRLDVLRRAAALAAES